MKTYVLDTNVIISNPDLLDRLLTRDNEVFIPLEVMEELDKLKKRPNIAGNIRSFFNSLEENEYNVKYHSAWLTKEHPVTRLMCEFESQHYDEQPDWFSQSMDNLILLTFIDICQNLAESEPHRKVILLSNDRALRTKTKSIIGDKLDNYDAEPYMAERVKNTSFYSSFQEILVEDDLLADLHRGIVFGDEFYDLNVNEFAIVRANPSDNPTLVKKDRMSKQEIHAYPDAEDDTIMRVINFRNSVVSGVTPKNLEQLAAFNVGMDPEIPLVALSGPAGTGKTFSTMAMALALVEAGIYDQILIARPLESMGGHKVGFLPGTLDDKLKMWMNSFRDAVNILVGGSKKQTKTKKGGQRQQPDFDYFDEYVNFGKIKYESLEHIRGRSFVRVILILDESQDVTRHDIKTIVSRMGTDSKLFLLGDPNQIDSRFLDLSNNGLSHTINSLRGQELFAHVHLGTVLRSKLAKLAVELL